MTPPLPILPQVKGAGTAGAEVSVDSKKNPPPPPPPAAEESKDPKQITLTLDASALWGANGYNDSYLFPGSYGKLGDFNNFRLGSALMWDVNEGKVRFRVGPRAQVDIIRGNQNTGSSWINGYSLGVQGELDIARHTTWGIFTLLPRARVHWNPLGLAHGLNAPEGFISRHAVDPSHFHDLGVGIDVFQFNIGKFSLAAGVDYSTTAVADGDGQNNAHNWIGFSINGRGNVKADKERVVVTPPPEHICPSTKVLVEDYIKEIKGEPGKPGLIDQVKASEERVAVKRQHIETRELKPLDVAGVRDELRKQKIEELAEPEIKKAGLSRLKKEDEPAIEKIDAKVLPEAKEKWPDIFQDDFNFWEPKTKMVDYESLKIPDPLPDEKHCDDLAIELKKVKQARDDLSRRLGELETIEKTPLPPRIREVVAKVINSVEPSLKKIHFENDRPNPADMKKFDKALAENLAANGGKVNWDDPKLKKALNPIFDSKKTGSQYTNEVIQIVKDTITALNQDLVNKIKNIEVQGHTSLAGDDAHNLGLSKRRAELITKMLTAGSDGIAPDRLTAKGYGETRPIHPDEESFPKNSAQRATKAAENRRMELVVPDAEINKLESAGLEVPELDSKKKKAEEPKKTDPKKDPKKTDPKPDPKPDPKKTDPKPDPKKTDPKKDDDGIDLKKKK